MKKNTRFIALAITLGQDGTLPTEFRLFTKGVNETSKGSFLFDSKAAASVMAAYKAWGVDLAIDLEHQMLDNGPAADPTARDARGWCNLELRPDGSLWAVNVKWTPDGAARLAEKRQRYVSPAFCVDPETSRITSILNIAITAIPATHGTPALVAADSRSTSMTIEEFMKVIKALGIDPTTSLEDAMAKIKGQAPTGDDAPPSSANGGPPDSSSGTPPAPVPAGGAPPPPAAKDDNKDKPEEVAAACGRLMHLTAAKSFVAAIATVDIWRASHLELETERQKLSAERATLESAERRRLCTELVTLGAEFPSTVWGDDKSTTLKARWLAMPIAELRTHTTEQRTARGGKRLNNITPPPGNASDGSSKMFKVGHKVVELSASELAICVDQKCDPAVFAALKSQRDSAVKTGGN